MPPTGCVLHVEHRRRPPVQETEEQNVQDVFGGLGQYRPNDAQTAPLAQPSHSHQAHQSGGRGLHLPTALPCFLGGYNEGKVRKTGSELPRVDFPYLIERSGGRGILPLVSRVPEPVLPKLTDSLRAVFCRHPTHAVTPLRVSLRYPEKVQNVLRFLPEA